MAKKKCPVCKGRGKWTEREDGEFGIEYSEVKLCEACQGTGVSQDVEDDEDFDFDGKGFGNAEIE